MKKALIVASALALCLGLWGCGSPQSDPKAEAKAYIEEVRPIIDQISADFNAEFEALQDEDADKCVSLCADVRANCDKVIEMDDIPEMMEAVHGKYVDYAEHISEAALDFATAVKLKEVDIAAAASSVADGTAEVREANKAMEEVTTALQEATAKLGS